MLVHGNVKQVVAKFRFLTNIAQSNEIDTLRVMAGPKSETFSCSVCSRVQKFFMEIDRNE